MPRKADWEREVEDGLWRESWSLLGPNRIVKVVELDKPRKSEVDGYITVALALVGKTPEQIEDTLGLPKNHLRNGARIYKLARLPMRHEYEYDLTSEYPKGLACSAADIEAVELEKLRKEDKMDPISKKFSEEPFYPPASPRHAVHQWRIRYGIKIPVDQGRELLPGQKFLYHWAF